MRVDEVLRKLDKFIHHLEYQEGAMKQANQRIRNVYRNTIDLHQEMVEMKLKLEKMQNE